MNVKIKILGWIHTALGGIGLIAGLALCAGLWFSPDDKSTEALLYVGPLFSIMAVFMLLPALIGGIGLLRLRPWARILIIIISALEVLSFPIGTVLGGFGLWVLLDGEVKAAFAGSPTGAAARAAP
jgi:hypothetical protein